ncbi:GNAT family N-acetyltransferase [Sandaracinus amylolyticus]|uniref:GNAT family N-acetyltransferase n=1 Tax=Sandaracinus amylolyticus TaxID=927083 RepID=UPI001F32AA7E|nr:GNAT family N-acetyltransferase [Sandaracinus amylolyticus]UJR81623.1 L-methionine sulfoximine N-acetyltransferase [Sandaracinus amylolyticus]
MTRTIRDATPADAAAISRIYNFYVRTSTCTYALEEETLDERRAWLDAHGPMHPVLVVEEEGEVVAWGSLSTYNPRRGYARTVEDSIYVRDDQRGKGIGRALLSTLIERARALGHHTIIAGASADQDASIALHAAHGFVEVARLREVGRKYDRWLDVVYLQKML